MLLCGAKIPLFPVTSCVVKKGLLHVPCWCPPFVWIVSVSGAGAPVALARPWHLYPVKLGVQQLDKHTSADGVAGRGRQFCLCWWQACTLLVCLPCRLPLPGAWGSGAPAVCILFMCCTAPCVWQPCVCLEMLCPRVLYWLCFRDRMLQQHLSTACFYRSWSRAVLH